MKRLLLLPLILLLAGCGVEGTPQPTSNPEVKVTLLFELEGYRMYRLDDGNFVYFLLPAPKAEKVAQAAWSEDCGDGCVRPVLVTTQEGEK